MEPTKELVLQLRLDEIEDARRMTIEEKLRAGPDLFDYACAVTRAGIRMDHPLAGPAEVHEILRQRLELSDRMRRER